MHVLGNGPETQGVQEMQIDAPTSQGARVLRALLSVETKTMYVNRSPEEIDAANKYHTWVRGYRDGFGSLAKRKDHIDHPKFGAVYLEAYDAGHDAGNKMREEAATRFGYVPSVLRGDDNGTSGTSA